MTCEDFIDGKLEGRIWLDGSCRLACCLQRTWDARQAWGQGAWLLLWWGNSTGVHRLWSSNTCVRVSLRCSATWGFATSLLPRTKSLPVGWVHNGVGQLLWGKRQVGISLAIPFAWASSLCQLYFHGMRALLGEGNMLLPHPCFGRVCLPEGTGWGNWLERLTSARVLLAQKWVEPTSGTGGFCGCSRVSGRCRVHVAAICRFQVGRRQFFQPILLTLPRCASSPTGF